MSIRAVVGGAGVAGLAIARGLALRGYEVIVIEANKFIGMETSSRNSEVIHSGVYYKKNSLKANLCVEGRKLLYDYCDEFHIPYNACGKLIVATSEEEEKVLDELKKKSIQNGLTGSDALEYLDKKQIFAIEPLISATKALFSPSTGIINSHELMKSLQGEAELNGALFSFNTKIIDVKQSTSSLQVFTENSEFKEKFEFEADIFINSVGLEAPKLASKISNLRNIPIGKYGKGNYFKLTSREKFNHLIYPVPVKNNAGLGIHLTLDLDGNVKFGPDLEWVNEVDYFVDENRKQKFYESIRRYYPNLKENSLVADYSGIRPKLVDPNENEQDFVVIRDEKVTHLLGIESPGLTSCLSLANYVITLIEKI